MENYRLNGRPTKRDGEMKKTVQNEKIRNVAIIAHVDHGKTTLVDFMLRQSGVFRINQEVSERVLDSMDLEREKGITIMAKNCSVIWKGVKINIVDTPGHADFGGEVERALKMVDGALLLVDASEGPLPQTRFVLRKALEAGHKIIVVINKIDRKDARPKEVLEEIFDLFVDLAASDAQLDFPVIYAVGKEGRAQKSLEQRGENLEVLFSAILDEIPPPGYNPEEPFQMLVCDLDYSDYIGRLAVGRVFNGRARCSEQLVCMTEGERSLPLKVSKLQAYDGVSIKPVDTAEPGDIIILAGIEDVKIGDTICTKAAPKALRRIQVDEPTLSIIFSVNTSPFSGRDGNLLQSRKIRERLLRETLANVAIQVEDLQGSESFVVKGRGEFQMEILIEMMRREGFELTIGRPKVILKEKNGAILEPIEHLFIDCGSESVGIINEKLSRRKGRMVNMIDHGTGRVRIEYTVPSRTIIGYRGEFLTDTKGTGLMNSYLEGYEEHRGDFAPRTTGSLVADRSGDSVAYSLFNLEPRGRLFVVPGDPVYEGMIIGEHNREPDLNVNPIKGKKLSNMRARGKDENILLTPVTPMTLEKAITFIKDDEVVEVTPKTIRQRKIVLSAIERTRMRPKRDDSK
jgi:GTP-binding protein